MRKYQLSLFQYTVHKYQVQIKQTHLQSYSKITDHHPMTSHPVLHQTQGSDRAPGPNVYPYSSNYAEGPFVSSGMQSSNFTFNNQIGSQHQSELSGGSNFFSSHNFNRQGSNSPQVTSYQPSHEILRSQQNYAFTNKSSLRTLDQGSTNHSPSFTVYNRHSADHTKNIGYSPLNSQQTQRFDRIDTFGRPQYEKIPLPNHKHGQIQEYRRVSDFKSQPPVTGNSPVFQSRVPSNAVEAGDSHPKNVQNQNVTSRLMNRQLTQQQQIMRHSEDSLVNAHVIKSEGVQQFPLKFDSHQKEVKDFTGLCGYKGKRVTFDAAEKTPFC